MKILKKKNVLTSRTLKSVIGTKQTKVLATNGKDRSYLSTRNCGYIHVGVDINNKGEMTGLSVVKSKSVRGIGSIRLFIAGGKNIDEKVAGANAKLRK